LVPVASAAAWKIVLRRTWDAFEIPLPFSRVVVVVGPAVSAGADLSELEQALERTRKRAENLVAPCRSAASGSHAVEERCRASP
jgi:lysophospholipid acyltransferase (LPLAT)-like uncharacterized protein